MKSYPLVGIYLHAFLISIQLTEWLASLFGRWIVIVPPLRVEREFVEYKAIRLALLKRKTSWSCQDSSHHQSSFVQPATYCLYPLHNPDSFLLVCDSSRQGTPTSSEGKKFVTSCWISSSFLKVKVKEWKWDVWRRVEWIVARNLSTSNPPLTGDKVDVRE